MSTILSNGVAEVDSDVLNQLRSKHPPRPAAVRLPSMEEIKNEGASWEKESQSMGDMIDTKMDIDMVSEQAANDSVSAEYSSTFPYLVITEEQILTAAKKAKRLTAGGLQQITPWLLRRAFLEDTTNDCAMVACQVATRCGGGDFSTVLGELVAESKLIALYKDDKRKDVRPVSVGCSLRRLLTRAYCAQIREIISSHVQGSQLGVLKGGYEVGIHAMRVMTT